MRLFDPNNHSKSEILYSPVPGEKKDYIAKVLSECFQIQDVQEIAQVQEAEVNSNNYRIRRPQSTLLLRKYGSRDFGAIHKAQSISQYCASRRVPTPTLVRSAEHNGTEYALFSFLEGNHFSGSLEEVEEIGRGVALLHKALADYPEKNLPLVSIFLERTTDFYSPEGLRNLRGRIEDHSDIAPEVSQNYDYIIDVAERVKGILPGFDLQTQLTHNDLHPHNTLFSNRHLDALLDFDSCCPQERARDVAFALHRFVRQYIVKTSPGDLKSSIAEAKERFLSDYNQVNSLSSNEINALPVLIQDEALHRLWKVAHLTLTDSNKWGSQEIVKQLSSLKEAEYF